MNSVKNQAIWNSYWLLDKGPISLDLPQQFPIIILNFRSVWWNGKRVVLHNLSDLLSSAFPIARTPAWVMSVFLFFLLKCQNLNNLSSIVIGHFFPPQTNTYLVKGNNSKKVRVYLIKVKCKSINYYCIKEIVFWMFFQSIYIQSIYLE